MRRFLPATRAASLLAGTPVAGNGRVDIDAIPALS